MSAATEKRAKRIRAELKRDLAAFFDEDERGNVNVLATHLEAAGALAAAIAFYDDIILRSLQDRRPQRIRIN